jgi:hypothetical protein
MEGNDQNNEGVTPEATPGVAPEATPETPETPAAE